MNSTINCQTVATEHNTVYKFTTAEPKYTTETWPNTKHCSTDLLQDYNVHSQNSTDLTNQFQCLGATTDNFFRIVKNYQTLQCLQQLKIQK